jgi:putative ABC transport system ATP-binding protein/lipoprotein-releasing system ATP-binding protein
VIDGRDIQAMDSRELHRFRNEYMGFVFQFHYLLPELTALENVLMPAIKLKQENERRDYGISLLKDFGLAGKEQRFPSQLSGGEQQRVALARALVMNPKYVFADEPTGNLDTYNGEVVMNIFRRLNKENKTVIIYVTHDLDFAAYAERQIVLVDGRSAD